MKKEKELSKYMVKMAESLNLSVDEDGYIVNAGGKHMLIDDYKVAIPTKTSINTAIRVDGNKITTIHKILNPFIEDDLKRNPNLVLLMRYASATSSTTMYSIMLQLIALLGDTEMQESAHTSIQKWIVDLRKVIGNRGKLVTRDTNSAYVKIVSYFVENNLSIVKYRLSKGKTILGVKYLRTAVLDPDGLATIEKDYDEIGIKERDMKLFVSMIKFILPTIEDGIVGSVSKLYPSYMSAMGLYNETQGRLNSLLETVSALTSMPTEDMVTKLVDEDVESYKSDIEFIPSGDTQTVNTPVANMSMHDAVQTVTSTTPSINTNMVDTTEVSTTPTRSLSPLELLKQQTSGGANSHGFMNNGNSSVLGLNNQGMNNTSLGINGMSNNQGMMNNQNMMNNQGMMNNQNMGIQNNNNNRLVRGNGLAW